MKVPGIYNSSTSKVRYFSGAPCALCDASPTTTVKVLMGVSRRGNKQVTEHFSPPVCARCARKFRAFKTIFILVGCVVGAYVGYLFLTKAGASYKGEYPLFAKAFGFAIAGLVGAVPIAIVYRIVNKYAYANKVRAWQKIWVDAMGQLEDYVASLAASKSPAAGASESQEDTEPSLSAEKATVYCRHCEKQVVPTFHNLCPHCDEPL
jgi:Zn finger protein HypA/HybF involved in hydrogenase expression